ncbi:hypothetical protein EOM57_04450 [Candidatus Saccharibacteria bacterium]|nr:hypothetical protein [Candidatus Saccharibacteria bacterium]
MAYTNTNVTLLDKKEAQTMCNLPIATGTGGCFIAPQSGVRNNAMYVTSATVVYLYNHEDDGFMQITSPALAGTFGAGTCGCRHTWSMTYTANGGSTTTVTVDTGTHALKGVCVGSTLEMLSGTADNIGLRRTVTNFSIIGTTAGITLDSALPAAVASTDTFRMTTGRFFVLNAGALAANSFKVFDNGTMEWDATPTVTGLPASWGTSGKMVSTYTRLDVFATGTATSGSATTLVNSAKAWTVDQWIGYQVRITAGTGCGQVRTITDSDATSLTFATGATIDNTSQYSIEGNEDYLYLLGNAATAFYRYSISGNSWTTMTARTASSTTCMMAEWIGVTGNACWGNEDTIQDGKYIYSPRGGATATLYRYNISTNAWETMTYNGIDTFTTGSSMTAYKDNIYIQQNSTGRFFQYNIPGNYSAGYFTDSYTQSTAREGDKIWMKLLDEEGSVAWLYYALNNLTALRRIMIY